MLAVMTPPLSLVERKQRQARQRIIEAARELFLERGFDGVSVGDIAERAEVGRTTFFRHFGDKQEVVFAKEQELLDAIAAAVIGGASLSGGVGRITGTVIGTLILGVVTSGFTFLRIDAYYQEIVKGAIIVVAVIADQYRRQGRLRRG